MDQEQIYKYLSGQSSEEEAEKIMAWLDDDIKNRKQFIRIKKSWIESFAHYRDHALVDEAFGSFILKIEEESHSVVPQKGKTNYRVIFRYAAVILALFTFSITGFIIGKRSGFLAGNQYYEVVVPYGGKSSLILSDGTEITLNAGSKLRYQKDFGKDSRNVYLEGEAYFNVKKSRHPFVVHTSHLDISVLGTVFNVKSYPEENQISTTLVEGKIRIDPSNIKNPPVYLTENQKLTFYKDRRFSEITGPKDAQKENEQIKELEEWKQMPSRKAFEVNTSADIERNVSWKDGKLIFDGESLETLAVLLQRKYDVTFRFESEELKSYTYSGTLKDYTLEQVLNALKLTSPVEYSIQEKTVYFYLDEETKNKYKKITN